jgi:hypothetical protein
MKHFATAAIALVLSAGSAAAWADPPPPPPPHGGAHTGGGAPHGGAPGGAHGAGPAGAHGGAPGGHAGPPGGAAGALAFHPGGPPPGGGGQHGGGGAAGAGFRTQGLRPQDRGRVAFSVGAFARLGTASRRFHVAPPIYPGGWYYQSWSYGQYLPPGWFGAGYYLNWGYYGLPEPPIGCEWVREGPDAVLVDIWTGEVLSVYQGVFWW